MDLRARLLLHCDRLGVAVEDVLPVVKMVLEEVEVKFSRELDEDEPWDLSVADEVWKEIESCQSRTLSTPSKERD